ncbi:MAG: radical SAM protein [bacterium]
MNNENFSSVLERLIYSPRVRDSFPRLDDILQRARCAGLSVESRDSLPTFESFQKDKGSLYIHGKKKSLLKNWRSHPRLVGNDEWCLIPLQGCPMDCCYCYLQDYLQRPLVQLWPGWEELSRQIESKIGSTDSSLNFSLGEFSDGLFLEPLLEFLPAVWEVFRNTRATLEVRTKSHQVEPVLENLEPHEQGIFCWTLTPPGLARKVELFSAPPEKRLGALKKVLEAGFRAAVRFDPIFLKDNWLEAYRRLIREMKNYFPPDKLEYIMLGTFRFPAGFDRVMQQRFPGVKYLRDEMVRCPDGKYRYFRERRVKAYRQLVELFDESAPEIRLCMEFPYIWEETGL